MPWRKWQQYLLKTITRAEGLRSLVAAHVTVCLTHCLFSCKAAGQVGKVIQIFHIAFVFNRAEFQM